MKRFLLVLFLLCFSVTNTAFAVDRPIGDGFNCLQVASGPDLVSTSKALDAILFDFGIKDYRAYMLERLGSVSRLCIKEFQVSGIRKKWVWRSSLNDATYYIRSRNQLINA